MHGQRIQFPDDASLEFITDVEGNWEYLCALVARSKVLSWRRDDDNQLVLADKALFVFGGDAVDKGPGDIRVTKALVGLKRRYPERVFLLAGNRDVNKLRLAAELAEGELPDVDPVPYLDAISWQGAKQQFPEFLQERGLGRTPIAGLHWILEKTLGGATLFSTRQQELQVLGCSSEDANVLRSFADLVNPAASADAWTLEYIRLADIMVIIGDSLFVHGAVLSKGLLLVPAEDCRDGHAEGQPPPLRLADSTPLEVWAEELNSWKSRQLRLFEAFPHFQKDVVGAAGQRWRGGQPLMFPSLAGCHVMTDGFLKNGNGAPLDEDVEEYLARNGINRIFAGHQPQGQSPGVVRNPRSGILLIVADTTFSDVQADKSRNPADTRGGAVSVVRANKTATTITGVLADGTEHGFTLNSNWDEDTPVARLIGRQFCDSSWGRTVVAGQLQTCRGEGFKLHHALVDPAEAETILADPYASSMQASVCLPIQSKWQHLLGRCRLLAHPRLPTFLAGMFFGAAVSYGSSSRRRR